MANEKYKRREAAPVPAVAGPSRRRDLPRPRNDLGGPSRVKGRACSSCPRMSPFSSDFVRPTDPQTDCSLCAPPNSNANLFRNGVPPLV